MTAKRFTIGDRTLQEVYECCIPAILDGGIPCTQSQVLKLLNELHEENLKLKSENNMLRNTIGRNEAYIERLRYKGKWNNTSDETE